MFFLSTNIVIFFFLSANIYKKMDYNDILFVLKKYSISDDEYSELGEQDAAAGSSPAGGYPTVTKWETGLTRSVANQIDYKAKWKDLYKITRGKANTLL
jgi:hypothetical protein